MINMNITSNLENVLFDENDLFHVGYWSVCLIICVLLV